MATEEHRLPVFDYHVISDGVPPNQPPKQGDKWKETVWKEAPPPGSWNHGEELGEIEIHALGPPGTPNFHAEFPVDDDDRIKIDGKVPGGDGWSGKGKATATGKGRQPVDIDIEFRNPKRW